MPKINPISLSIVVERIDIYNFIKDIRSTVVQVNFYSRLIYAI